MARLTRQQELDVHVDFYGWALQELHDTLVPVPYVEAAHAEPRLRQFHPLSSHWTLGFNAHTGIPCLPEVAIVPSYEDRSYRVQKFPHGGVIAEAATAEEAAALAVAHLPAGLGPAGAGTSEPVG